MDCTPSRPSQQRSTTSVGCCHTTSTGAKPTELRVVRLAWDYPTDGKPSYGLQPVYYYLSREQAKLGYDVQVIAKKHGSQPDEEIVEMVKVHRVRQPFNLNAFLLLQRLIKREPRTLIHSHATCGLFLAMPKKLVHAPRVSHVHGTSRSAYMPAGFRFGPLGMRHSVLKSAYSYARERKLWSTADRVLAVSQTVKSDLSKYYGIPPAKITAVYNGVDMELFKPQSDPQSPPGLDLSDKRVVLYVGHFGPRKGIPFLIAAMRKIAKEVHDSVLVCVGGTPAWLGRVDYRVYLREAIQKNDLDGRVFLLDKVPNGALPIYYSLASVAVLPSYYEAFAKVVIEAMACERPVVVSKEGGPSEAVDDGETGFLVDYGSAEQIADAVVRILRDQRLARRIGSNARRRVERDFTWAAVARRIDLVYNQIVGG